MSCTQKTITIRADRQTSKDVIELLNSYWYSCRDIELLDHKWQVHSKEEFLDYEGNKVYVFTLKQKIYS
mgnify:FL=1